MFVKMLWYDTSGWVMVILDTVVYFLNGRNVLKY